MNKNLHILILMAILVLPTLTYAQFNISAELRPRLEMDNGTLKPFPDSLNTVYFVSQRTRLKFDLNKEKYQMRLSIQDVRFWGSGDIYTSTGVFGSTGGIDIQEAWFRLKLGAYSKLTIGRQVLKLDDQRLIATRNWNQFGMAYDAISYMFTKDKWILNAAVSYNTNSKISNGKLVSDNEFFNTFNLMKTLNYIHLKRNFHKNFSAALMAFASGYEHSTSKDVLYITATYGFWWNFDNAKFDVSSNLYFQGGKAQTGKSVMAYMATIHPGIKFGKVRIGLGGDYISGDNAKNDDFGQKERTFNLMYGAVFKYYGSMNYYSYMKGSTANGGLIDIYPNISVPINDQHSLTAFYHKFYLANPVLIQGDVMDNTDLGSEVDLMYTYKIMKELVLQAGVSYYFTTESLEKVKKVDGSDIRSPYWVWTMITFTPELFSSK